MFPIWVVMIGTCHNTPLRAHVHSQTVIERQDGKQEKGGENDKKQGCSCLRAVKQAVCPQPAALSEEGLIR